MISLWWLQLRALPPSSCLMCKTLQVRLVAIWMAFLTVVTDSMSLPIQSLYLISSRFKAKRSSLAVLLTILQSVSTHWTSLSSSRVSSRSLRRPHLQSLWCLALLKKSQWVGKLQLLNTPLATQACWLMACRSIKEAAATQWRIRLSRISHSSRLTLKLVNYLSRQTRQAMLQLTLFKSRQL